MVVFYQHIVILSLILQIYMLFTKYSCHYSILLYKLLQYLSKAKIIVQSTNSFSTLSMQKNIATSVVVCVDYLLQYYMM